MTPPLSSSPSDSPELSGERIAEIEAAALAVLDLHARDARIDHDCETVGRSYDHVTREEIDAVEDLFADLSEPQTIAALCALARRAQEAETLLDRVEISDGGETFDGSIAGGAPCDVDLFTPGPKFREWEAAVRANRRAREVSP